MRSAPLLLSLLLATATLAFVPSAEAIEPRECIRNGPPCGVDLPCVVGNGECLVWVHWVVCVTEPCDPPTVCFAAKTFCVVLGS